MLLLTSFLLVALFQIFFPSYMIFFGGFAFLPVDSVYFLMILKIGRYALRHPRSMAELIRENFFLMAFLAMVALYVILYTPTYGQSAIGEARKFYFIFLLPLVALISIKRTEDLRRLFLALVFGAGWIAMVALVEVVTSGSIVRVLNSEGTLFVALVALGLLIHRMYGVFIVTPVLDKVLLWLFFIIVLGSGQRSVWLGFGLGLICMFLIYIRRPVFVSRMFLLAVVIVVGLTTVLLVFPQAGTQLEKLFEGIIDPYDDRTASWRIAGWQAQWDTVKQNLFFGQGIGNYYSWTFSGLSTVNETQTQYQVTASPHNAYIQMMLKFGLFGLILYGLLAIKFFHLSLGTRRKLQPGPMKAYVEMGIVTFGATQVYILGYHLEPISLIFFSIAIAAAKLSQPKFQTSRLGTRAVRNNPRIVSQRFRLQNVPRTIRS